MFLFEKNRHPSVETKPDPRSIEGLIAWLETMPPEQTYCYEDTGGCPYSLYGEFLGLGKGRHAYEDCIKLFSGKRYASAFDEPFRGYGELNVPQGWDRTIRGALARARAYQAKVRT